MAKAYQPGYPFFYLQPHLLPGSDQHISDHSVDDAGTAVGWVLMKGLDSRLLYQAEWKDYPHQEEISYHQLGNIAGIIVPVVVSFLVSVYNRWTLIFYIVSAVLIIGVIIWNLFASGGQVLN